MRTGDADQILVNYASADSYEFVTASGKKGPDRHSWSGQYSTRLQL